jgi:hypothetical protein
MRRSPVRLVLLLAALLAAAAPARGSDRISIGGYVKSFVVGFDQPDIGPIEGDFLWANNNRARANLGVRLLDWLEFDGSYDLSLRIQDDRLFAGDPILVFPTFPVYRVKDPDALIWPDSPGVGDHVALYQNLDRLYLTASAPWFDVIVGRQVIAWGAAHAINPTDVITPFFYTDIDVEDRIGVDAARVRIPLGSLAELDAGYVAGKDFEWPQSAAFVRGRFYALKTDVSLLTMAFRENLMVGGDVARTIGRAGAWCEAAYVWADAAGRRTAYSENLDYMRLSIGMDYNFNVGPGLYTFLEYHFNEAGAHETRRYVSNIFENAVAYSDGAVYLLGRHYLIPGMSYQLTALTTLSINTLVNLTDGSVLLAPYVEYNLTENTYISVGGYGAFGDGPAIGLFGPVLNSEFGAYPQQYYAFLRYYF